MTLEDLVDENTGSKVKRRADAAEWSDSQAKLDELRESGDYKIDPDVTVCWKCRYNDDRQWPGWIVPTVGLTPSNLLRLCPHRECPNSIFGICEKQGSVKWDSVECDEFDLEQIHRDVQMAVLEGVLSR